MIPTKPVGSIAGLPQQLAIAAAVARPRQGELHCQARRRGVRLPQERA